MKSIIILFSLLILTGCSTVVPVKQKFPEIPEVLKEKCPTLVPIDQDTTTLSNLTKTITSNYTKYHECATRVEAWIEWHKSQKDIFNKVK